ncbi:MAG: acyl-CoA thioesterase [Rhodocyclaceae bacterium]|nr:acyl-CoA thioesterase [Rhodocyclaceae bacterium]
MSHLTPREEELALRVIPFPSDANPYGDIFGGWIMSHVDVAGAVPAHRRARGRVATVAVNAFTFKQPVAIGDVVSFYARVVKEGRTSVVVDVEVYAERGHDAPEKVKVTEATLTYVAVNPDGTKRELPA